MMKKVLVLLLTAGMVIGLAACGADKAGTADANSQAASGEADAGQDAKDADPAAEAADQGSQEAEIPETDVLVGGWAVPDSPEIPEDVLDAFERAMEGLTGVGYVPVALIGTQVVSGMNYRILCEATPVVANPETHYAIVTVYEDLSGNAEITGIADSEMKADFNELPGGWFRAESPAVTEEVTAAFDKIAETLTGMELRPAALLGSQVVAGTNYLVFCESAPATPADPTAKRGYVFAKIYADLNGNAEITELTDF